MPIKQPWAIKLPINEHGFVTEFKFPYPISFTEYKQWRTHIPRADKCEIPRCKTNDARFVYDHCHIHNFIRGMVCATHNMVDLRHNAPVYTKWHRQWILRCPECVTIIDRINPQSPGQWRDAISLDA